MLSEGLHRATIVDHAFDKARSGNDQLIVRFETDEGFHTEWFTITDKTAERFAENVREMGFNGDDFLDLADGRALRGNVCYIQIRHKDGQDGNKRAGIVWVQSTDRPKELRRNETAARNVQRFNALLRAKKPTGASPPAASKPAADDDPPPF